MEFECKENSRSGMMVSMQRNPHDIYTYHQTVLPGICLEIAVPLALLSIVVAFHFGTFAVTSDWVTPGATNQGAAWRGTFVRFPSRRWNFCSHVPIGYIQLVRSLTT